MDKNTRPYDPQNTLEGSGVDLDVAAENNRKSILVVDDENDTVFLLKQILRMAGFNVLSAMSGDEALQKISGFSPNIVLLDLMMPERDGWDTFNHLRKVADTPVIVISALGSKEQMVEGLKMGVDDYIPKPFHNAEVIERVKAVLRRSSNQKEISRLIFPNIELLIDLETKEVQLHDQVIYLTPKEFAVLAILAKHAPAIVSYETIAQEIWNSTSEEINKRTKYLVYLLRRKFEQVDPDQNLILNIDRLGYKLLSEEK